MISRTIVSISRIADSPGRECKTHFQRKKLEDCENVRRSGVRARVSAG